ncbi:MAG: carboxypeptidase regulatory-like domain-containing protein, partial [Candidatus Brocadiae bacterium]|nr:carboxypeptidase regulatory-like domain-containing protein [Candidatus Brocadiia bacterium]
MAMNCRPARASRTRSSGRPPTTAVPALVLLAALVLTALWGGAARAVRAAARALTPQERIERIKQAQKAHGPRQYGEADRILVTGNVHMHDDGPLPADVRVTLYSRGPARRAAYGPALEQGRFVQRVAYGDVYAFASAEGYAPAFAGPLEAEPGGEVGEVTDLQLVLSPGFGADLRLTGIEGEPIPDAKVEVYYVLEDFHVLPAELRADRDGVARLEHLVDRHVRLSVTADGYQYERREHRFRPGGTLTWRLRPSRPTGGSVVSRATREPIAGAEVCLIHGPLVPFVLVNHARAAAVSDQLGRFRLGSLRDDGTYDLVVRAPGYAPGFLHQVRVGQTDLKVELGPEIYVRGRILGPLDALQRYEEKPIVTFETTWGSGRGSIGFWDYALVEVRDGVGHFEITGLWEGRFTV